MPRKDSNDILSSRPPIRAYEEEKYVSLLIQCPISLSISSLFQQIGGAGIYQ